MSLPAEKFSYFISTLALKKGHIHIGTQPYINDISALLGRQDWMLPPDIAKPVGMTCVFVGALSLKEADMLEANGAYRIYTVGHRPSFCLQDKGVWTLQP